MKNYFNVPIEFNRQIIHDNIESTIHKGQKGYVCLIESNNLSEANLNPDFKKIVEGASMNLCDGSVVALLLSIIHRKKLPSYTGSEIFINTIQSKKYSHYFLGNTQIILDGLKPVLQQFDEKTQNAHFIELPFCDIDEFDYKTIAHEINNIGSDCIWISLGAPKQEIFMSKLIPYIDRGILFGVGAAFNFHSKTSSIKRAPKWMLRMRIEWLYRVVREPKKSIPRYCRFIGLLPMLIACEIKKINNPAS